MFVSLDFVAAAAVVVVSVLERPRWREDVSVVNWSQSLSVSDVYSFLLFFFLFFILIFLYSFNYYLFIFISAGRNGRAVFNRSNTGIVGSNSLEAWMCVRVFLCCAVLRG
jgi:hypothetical protein